MKIELNEISIREITKNYVDNAEEGVVGLDGKLNIRPKYQREFVYDKKKRDAVIETIKKGFPLNTMYWIVNEDGMYEVLDGQQRTISFCQYVNSDFSVNGFAFHNLTKEEQEQILDYKCMVYLCEGTEREKLDWFKIINIAGEKLTDQELRNAVYTGKWLTHAKSIFSKTKCPASQISADYVKANTIRQELLETALKWISKNNIEMYMSEHQCDEDANELFTYFTQVINWVTATFVNKRKEMQSVNWGELYDEYKDHCFNVNELEEEIEILMADDDVTNKKGIYHYVLTRSEKYLNIRTFTTRQKRTVYEKQKGICAHCEKKFNFDDMEGDHIIPWSEGGKTVIENCQMLCRNCNRTKGKK